MMTMQQSKDFCGSDLTEANFSAANLNGAYFGWANLAEAIFCGSDLTGTNFNRANFSGAYLGWTNLTGAYLSGADFTGAHWDKNTIWPDGIGPLNDQPTES